MLEDFIQVNGIKAQITLSEERVGTGDQAQRRDPALPVVKTILLAHEQGFVLAILEAPKKISFPKIERLLSTTHLRLATPTEVEEVTGYPIGGVPPISIYGTPTLIDEQAMVHSNVVAGGGSAFALLTIASTDIAAHAYEARIVDITV